MTEPALHVSNGDSTDVPGTGLAQRVLYWRDSLHEGPVPDVGPEELRETRAGFLAASGVDDRAEGSAVFAERDRVLEAGRDGEYVLWFEADLYDQLQIVQVLDRLAGLGVEPSRITLICIGEYPGIARFGGLGELTADQLRELPATNACAVLTSDALELAVDAWAVFRAPAPDRIAEIAAHRSGELRFLGEAFDRLGREYPSTRDGLSLTERRVLAAVASGAADAGTAFVRAAARETRPYLGDSWCFLIMERLAHAPVPLLTASDDRITGQTRLSLTGTGAEVLAGRADHVTINGVDRWIGGVHLRGSRPGWRWDEGTEAVTRW
ncbi:hypothetical protein SK854_08905 [Lentzea sp. BCCO 10_0061]|uniref:DUF1835 domain-containing protein n=1 Tax=Lentzea sokolovensis TaxID=3095429 RepID=A0ABU4URW2_9PSEU|nr:hypothetical protein [Lentzea sp. BCCO 10_0061]MDX8142228.1 hypothetical protein [Lentzea sp. BCCO 10_0061]